MAKTVKCARKGCGREWKVGFLGSVVGHRSYCKVCRVGLLEPGRRISGGMGEVRFGPFGGPDHRTVTRAMLGDGPQSAAARRRAAVMHGLANNPNFEVRPDDFKKPDLTVQIDPVSGTAEVNFGPDFGFLDAHRGCVARSNFAAARGLDPGPEVFETEEPSAYDFTGGVVDGQVLNTTYL